MNIYVVTDNIFFFTAIKEGLPFSTEIIKKISARQLESDSMMKFNRNDIFIFHTSNFGVELSFHILTGSFPGEAIIVPTAQKGNLKLAFSQYVLLDTHATIDDIYREIIESTRRNTWYGGLIEEPQTENLLTEREKVILRHTIDGLDAQEISKCLSISVKTVYTHRLNAFQKLGGRNLFEIWPSWCFSPSTEVAIDR